MICQEWALSPFCYATAAPETRNVPSSGLPLSLAVEGISLSVSPVRGVCVCVISWGPTCTNCWIPAPPHSPSKDPGPCAFCTFPGGHRPRSCPGDTWLSPWGTTACSREWDGPHLPVPMTMVLNWVLSYLHIWLLWDHSWGQV